MWGSTALGKLPPNERQQDWTEGDLCQQVKALVHKNVEGIVKERRRVSAGVGRHQAIAILRDEK